MTQQHDRGKVMSYLNEVLSFLAEYNVWALVGMALCFVIMVILLVAGKKVHDPPPGRSITWDRDELKWESPSARTASFWLLLHEIRMSLGSDPNRLPLFRVFRGITDRCRADLGDMKVVMKSRQQGEIADRYTPSINGFILREKDGYHQVVDLNPQTGLPTDITRCYDRTVLVPQYRSGERLEFVVFVEVPSQMKLTAIKGLTAEQLVDVKVIPANTQP